MPDIAQKSWYSDRTSFVRSLDRWISRHRTTSKVGKESDWLGWDGWVRTDGARHETSDTPGTR